MALALTSPILTPAPSLATHWATVQSELLGGEARSLLELPLALRAKTVQQMGAVIEQAASLPTYVAGWQQRRNVWTGEYLSGSDAAQYRFAQMALRVERGETLFESPNEGLVTRATEWSRTYLQWSPQYGDHAARYTAIEAAVRGGFEKEAFIAWSREFWRWASPGDKQLAINLYFGRGVFYRPVARAIAERVSDLVGMFGAPQEIGIDVYLKDRRMRYQLARGDLFGVTSSASGRLIEHTHPDILNDPLTGARQGLVQDVPVTLFPGPHTVTISPSAEWILPSCSDLDVTVEEMFGVVPSTKPIVTHLLERGSLRERVLHPFGGALVLFGMDQTIFLLWARKEGVDSDQSFTDRFRDLAVRAHAQHLNLRDAEVTYDDVVRRRFDLFTTVTLSDTTRWLREPPRAYFVAAE